MKVTSLVLLFLVITAAGAYAAVQTGPWEAPISLPQPCTVVLCLAGLMFFGCLTKQNRIP